MNGASTSFPGGFGAGPGRAAGAGGADEASGEPGTIRPRTGAGRAAATQTSATRVNEAPLALLAPVEGEQRLRKHRRWCAGICGNSLLQAAEADLQLAGTELSEERKCAQAQPFEHVTAGA
jgi:hypothetical protein